MKKISLYDVPVGKTFVFHHRMYRRVGVFSPEEGYGVLAVPCVPVGVIHDNVTRHIYRYVRVDI